MKPCSIDGCDKPAKARGWCGAHWWRWRQHGDPLGAAYQPKPCSIAGCESISVSRGWCSAHYQRYRKWGDPTAGFPSPGARSDIDRFMDMTDRGGDCWLWMGHRGRKGYGQFKYGQLDMPAHRASYLLFVGPIPAGKQIDHRCRNTSCVNPRHLRVATNKQNGENKGLARNNTSGFRGVSLHKSGKWVAQVRHNGRHVYGGIYETAEEANAAAIALRNRLYTHNDLDRISE